MVYCGVRHCACPSRGAASRAPARGQSSGPYEGRWSEPNQGQAAGEVVPCPGATRYASTSLHLRLCADQQLLHLAWQPGATPAGFQQGVTAAVALTHAQALRGWLTDNAHVYPLPPPQQLWQQEHALLPLNHSSLQRVAIVLPAAGCSATPESLIRLSRPLVSYQINYFAALPPAWRWVMGGHPAHP